MEQRRLAQFRRRPHQPGGQAGPAFAVVAQRDALAQQGAARPGLAGDGNRDDAVGGVDQPGGDAPALVAHGKGRAPGQGGFVTAERARGHHDETGADQDRQGEKRHQTGNDRSRDERPSTAHSSSPLERPAPRTPATLRRPRLCRNPGAVPSAPPVAIPLPIRGKEALTPAFALVRNVAPANAVSNRLCGGVGEWLKPTVC
ncbi:conserved protein of unknown function [Magnetospirillum sp. XM-1]|nr:conserved protein of unknown function [Magnetospirillum sp. XM-1]